LKVGDKAHIVPVPGGAPATAAAPGATQAGACASAQLCANGGSTMNTSKTYAIYWLPSGTHFEAARTAASDTNYENIVSGYFQKVGNINFYNILTKYSTSNYTILNSSTFGGSCVDTTPYTSVGSGDAGTSASPLLDTDIEAEVANAISVCGFGNPDTMMAPTVEYFIFTGLDVESCFDDGHNDCSATDTNGNADYCAYHSYSDVGAGNNAILREHARYVGALQQRLYAQQRRLRRQRHQRHLTRALRIRFRPLPQRLARQRRPGDRR
jgi:hypothetical protein